MRPLKRLYLPLSGGAAIKSLDIEKDKFLIIECILEHGGDKQINFIASH